MRLPVGGKRNMRTVYAVTTGEYSYYRVACVCDTQQHAVEIEKTIRRSRARDTDHVGWEPLVLLEPGETVRRVTYWETSISSPDSDRWSAMEFDGETWKRDAWDYEIPDVAAGNVVAQCIIVTNDRKNPHRIDLSGPTKAAVVAAAKNLVARSRSGDRLPELLEDSGSRVYDQHVVNPKGDT